MVDYEKTVRSLLRHGDYEALTDAFAVCRELETVDSVKVEGTGRRERPTTVYDKGNFLLAHNLNREIRVEAKRAIKFGADADRMQDLYLVQEDPTCCRATKSVSDS